MTRIEVGRNAKRYAMVRDGVVLCGLAWDGVEYDADTAPHGLRLEPGVEYHEVAPEVPLPEGVTWNDGKPQTPEPVSEPEPLLELEAKTEAVGLPADGLARVAALEAEVAALRALVLRSTASRWGANLGTIRRSCRGSP